MDYDVIYSKERLTGRAYFNPGIAGGTGITSMPWLDLGNIQLMNLDYGIKRKEHYKARRGMLISDRLILSPSCLFLRTDFSLIL